MVPLAPAGVFGAIYNYSYGMTALIYLVAGIAMVFSALSYKEMAKDCPGCRFGLFLCQALHDEDARLHRRVGDPSRLSAPPGAAVDSRCVRDGSPGAGYPWLDLGCHLRGPRRCDKPPRNRPDLPHEHDLLDHPTGSRFVLTDTAVPAEFISLALVFGAIPLAVLAYIGFDAISTLNEEARGGGRTVSKATMIVLVLVTLPARRLMASSLGAGSGDLMRKSLSSLTAGCTGSEWRVPGTEYVNVTGHNTVNIGFFAGHKIAESSPHAARGAVLTFLVTGNNECCHCIRSPRWRSPFPSLHLR